MSPSLKLHRKFSTPKSSSVSSSSKLTSAMKTSIRPSSSTGSKIPTGKAGSISEVCKASNNLKVDSSTDHPALNKDNLSPTSSDRSPDRRSVSSVTSRHRSSLTSDENSMSSPEGRPLKKRRCNDMDNQVSSDVSPPLQQPGSNGATTSSNSGGESRCRKRARSIQLSFLYDSLTDFFSVQCERRRAMPVIPAALSANSSSGSYKSSNSMPRHHSGGGGKSISPSGSDTHRGRSNSGGRVSHSGKAVTNAGSKNCSSRMANSGAKASNSGSKVSKQLARNLKLENKSSEPLVVVSPKEECIDKRSTRISSQGKLLFCCHCGANLL